MAETPGARPGAWRPAPKREDLRASGGDSRTGGADRRAGAGDGRADGADTQAGAGDSRGGATDNRAGPVDAAGGRGRVIDNRAGVIDNRAGAIGRQVGVADSRGGVVDRQHPLSSRTESANPPKEPDDTGRVVRSVAIDVGGVHWERLLIRTHVIQPGEDILEVMERYVRPYLRPGDWVFVGQKAVSIAQGRLVQERSVHPRPLAVFLSRHVKRTPFGRGLGRPTTMEIALREAGVPRILVACAVHLVGRPFGRSGDFYRIAGRRVASIDGVTDWALPPFNRYIVLHPDDADGLCSRIAARLKVGAAIVDLNDLGGEVLGASQDLDRRLVVKVLADNPLGQGPFRTPLGIARRVRVTDDGGAGMAEGGHPR